MSVSSIVATSLVSLHNDYRHQKPNQDEYDSDGIEVRHRAVKETDRQATKPGHNLEARQQKRRVETIAL
jgi:hypothetical protein